MRNMRGQPTDPSIPVLSSFLPDSFPTYSLADRENPHPTVAEEPLAKTEYSAISKKPRSRVEYISTQRLGRLILMKC